MCTIGAGDEADDDGDAIVTRTGAAAGADAGAEAATPAGAGRATSCRLRRPDSSSTMRAKKSLSAVSATVTLVAAPGAIASSMPRSESVFQLRSCRPAGSSRAIASARCGPPRSPAWLVARKSSIAASPRSAMLAPAPRRSQRRSPLKLVCAFCTSMLTTSSR